MFRKVSIKILLSVFTILLALVVLVNIIDSRKGDRTFKKDLIEVEINDITSIQISPKIAGGETFTLKKENNIWKVVSDNNGSYNADKNIAGSLISELNRMKPESVVATSKDKWSQFEVTDSLGTNVKLLSGNEIIADLYVGKFSFSQPRKMTSYVRLSGDKDVYGVDGFLSMSFNRDFDSFRDKTVISSTTSNWTNLQFSYPADSSFILSKIENLWTVNGNNADSTLVAEYFSSLSALNESSFAEAKPLITPTHVLKIEGNNMMTPVEIKGYYMDEENFIIESNQNPGTFFKSKELADKVFASGNIFIL